MAAVTRIAAYGGPGGRYGSFAGKTPGGGGGSVGSEVHTRIAGYGGPGQRYGSFAGKSTGGGGGGAVGSEVHTRVGSYGGPRQRYGSFAGKSTGDTVKSGWPTATPLAQYAQAVQTKTIRLRYVEAETYQSRVTRKLVRRLMREDEELIAILMAAVYGGVL